VAGTAANAKNAWLPSTTYIISFDGATVSDLAGASLTIKAADSPDVCFKTGT